MLSLFLAASWFHEAAPSLKRRGALWVLFLGLCNEVALCAGQQLKGCFYISGCLWCESKGRNPKEFVFNFPGLTDPLRSQAVLSCSLKALWRAPEAWSLLRSLITPQQTLLWRLPGVPIQPESAGNSYSYLAFSRPASSLWTWQRATTLDYKEMTYFCASHTDSYSQSGPRL